jgi:hypothetical protein
MEVYSLAYHDNDRTILADGQNNKRVVGGHGGRWGKGKGREGRKDMDK